jgi:hypothetical protein
MAEIMGYPLGVCANHGPKLAVNGVPTCIKCKAKEDNAGRVMVINKVEDPGEDYFKNGKVNPQVAQEGVGLAKLAAPQMQIRQTRPAVYTLQSGLQEILDILTYIPMPSSMKQYKLLLSIKQKIEQAQQEGQNG